VALAQVTVAPAHCAAAPPAQGLVKLADFGVAAKLVELEEEGPPGGPASQPSVVGTPYWMAPEVTVSKVTLFFVSLVRSSLREAHA
jgi:serine/threonine protein kinase